MKLTELIEAFIKAGVKIDSYHGCYFFTSNGIYYSFPPVYQIPERSLSVNSLRWKHLITVIYTDLQIKNTYEFILRTNQYNLEDFDKKVRNRIRKSLQNCTFKRPGLSELINDGLNINRATCQRQHRNDNILTEPAKWNHYISTLYNRDKFIIQGAFYNNRMVGYIVAYWLEDKCNILHAYIDRKDAEVTSPMNGLIYNLVNQLITEHGSVHLSYGIESFSPLPELNRFKCNMLFEKIPVTRLFLLHPLLIPFIRFYLFCTIHIMNKKIVHHNFTRKLIKLYQGHRLFFKVMKRKKAVAVSLHS